MIYWVIQKLPSTTNGKPNQIQYGKVEGYYSPSRLEILIPTSSKVDQANWRDEMTEITDDMRCFRCGKPIRNGEFYVHTLSNENAHVYCQATGVKPNKQEKGEGK